MDQSRPIYYVTGPIAFRVHLLIINVVYFNTDGLIF